MEDSGIVSIFGSIIVFAILRGIKDVVGINQFPKLASPLDQSVALIDPQLSYSLGGCRK